jgi:hypothetical protein
MGHFFQFFENLLKEKEEKKKAGIQCRAGALGPASSNYTALAPRKYTEPTQPRLLPCAKTLEVHIMHKMESTSQIKSYATFQASDAGQFRTTRVI